MEFFTDWINLKGWIWFLSFFFISILVVTGVTMIVTEKIERRHKEEFEQEFSGPLKPVSAEEE
ncbi:hypothetical protein [Salinithrix halophila]|uniref:Sporulation protein YhaL n=1 Tax=Salinithrix halophila TaxID=1485204 RepID=A0ABV8JD91_9BACL